MSDVLHMAASASVAVPAWITALSGSQEFTPDARYDPVLQTHNAPEPAEPEPQQTELARAHEEGRRQGLAEAAQQSDAQTAERRRLGSRLRRMDDGMIDQLGRQLSETVVALCEATLAPLAADRELLAQRCVKAARMLGGSNNDRTLHLHPGDIDALDDDFRQSWTIEPDPALPRGGLRIESSDGGISDGPGQWRAALRETLGLEGS